MIGFLLTLAQMQPKWSDPNNIPTAKPQGYEAMMVADGKIWVVMAVVLVIWFGVLFYLFRTDRKISALEKQIDSANPA